MAAYITKVGGRWSVTDINKTKIITSQDKLNGPNVVTNKDWCDMIGGGGVGIESVGHLFLGTDTTGMLYTTDQHNPFHIDQDITDIYKTLSQHDLDKPHDVTCFTPETLIATPFGDIPIEYLQAGDLVFTADNGAQPIRWIGGTSISGARLFASPDLRPIKICKCALGSNLPSDDIWVSPQHRMHMKSDIANNIFSEREVLVTAHSLINGTTIYADPDILSVDYIHILLEKHELVFANGALSESFHPGFNALDTLDEQAQSDLFVNHPELAEFPNSYGMIVRPTVEPDEASLIALELDKAAA